jgi:Protein of unknown function (DUF3667)
VVKAKVLDAEPCRNCGDTAPGVYCRMCGQRKGEIRISMRGLVAEVLEDQLAITSTLPRTLAALFLHPGRLTEEYTKGRIASWISPFRLYVAASLVFFFTVSITSRIEPDRGTIRVTGTTGTTRDSASIPGRASGAGLPLNDTRGTPPDTPGARPDMAGRTANTGAEAPAGRPARDSASELRGFGISIEPSLLTGDSADLSRAVHARTGIDKLDRLVEERIRDLAVLGPQQAGRTLIAGMVQRAPTAMFLLLPVFALLVQLLHLRSRRYYVEHFVFSLHYHAFAFTLNTLMVLFERTPIPAILGVWLMLYLPIALHRVYRNNWIVTLAKSLVLGGIYFFVLAIVLVGTLVAAVLIT